MDERGGPGDERVRGTKMVAIASGSPHTMKALVQEGSGAGAPSLIAMPNHLKPTSACYTKTSSHTRP